MKSIILRTASRYLFPLLLLFSIYVLLRGHNEPGGGFPAGLLASISFVLYTFANGITRSKELFKIHPSYWVPVGLIGILLNGLIPLYFDLPFLTSIWMNGKVPIIHNIGSAFFFEAGVFIIVIGCILTMVFTIIEER
jgi:multicomponent Na+:H+ antiporter subunit B